MNTQKLANLVAVGTREEDILDVLGCTREEYQLALTDDATKKQIQEAKGDRIETYQDLNDGWDAVEAVGVRVVLQTLQQNPDPSFALAAASQANKMRRRDASNGAIQPINAQQGNIVVIRLNQSFADRFADDQEDNFSSARVVSSQGMPKDINTLEVREAEKALIPVDEQHADEVAESIFGNSGITAFDDRKKTRRNLDRGHA